MAASVRLTSSLRSCTRLRRQNLHNAAAFSPRQEVRYLHAGSAQRSWSNGAHKVSGHTLLRVLSQPQSRSVYSLVDPSAQVLVASLATSKATTAPGRGSGMLSRLSMIGEFAGSFGRTFVDRVIGRQPSYTSTAEMEDWKKHATVVVTGANKGIGFAIARKLGKEGVSTILTARNPELGVAAQKQLKEEGVDVDFHQLDISDKKSIDSFAQWLEEKYGGLDILVNNAGFAFKGNTFGAEEAGQTNAINYFGTRDVTRRLLPLLKKSSAGARIVTVGSRAGTLSILGPQLRTKFADPHLTQEQLDDLMADFPKQIESGTYKQNGWPASMYGVSKVGVAAFSRILARELAANSDDSKVLVNVCCPGYVNTDMTSSRGYKTIDEGADTPVWLALQPPDGPSGRFFTDRKDVGY